MKTGYSFIISKWHSGKDDICLVRDQVLLDELGLPSGHFSEDDDMDAYHILVHDAAGRPVGTARMQRDGRIDYVAVLKPWRGVTVGGALLSYLHHIAQVTDLEILRSDIPSSAQKFFEKNGFSPIGDETLVDDHPYRSMVRNVAPRGQRISQVH